MDMGGISVSSSHQLTHQQIKCSHVRSIVHLIDLFVPCRANRNQAGDAAKVIKMQDTSCEKYPWAVTMCVGASLCIVVVLDEIDEAQEMISWNEL